VLRLSGRLDTETQAMLKTEFDGCLVPPAPRIVVDFADVDYISSAGLRVLLSGLKRARASKGDLCLAGLQDQVAQVFDISGFNQFFHIADTLADAVRILEEKQESEENEGQNREEFPML
jgi:anti-anti-sigma factor